MYKLMVIAGPNRGTSYAIQEGSVSVGRQSGNAIVLASSKVSKQHCVFEMSGSEVLVKDLGSSNGTFVNGILTKLKKIKPGDRVSVGEYVMELVEPAKRVVKAAPVSGLGHSFEFSRDKKTQGVVSTGLSGMPGMGMPAMGQLSPTKEPPKDLKGKVIWYFENQFMPIFYGLNTKHEWKIICVAVLAAFVVGNLLITVYPLTESSRQAVVKETIRRARFMAKQIVDQNSGFIASRMETKTEIGSIENAEGVRVAVLMDLENRILAPANKMNQYLTSGTEALFAVQARDLFRAGKEMGFALEADSSTVVAIEPVKVLNPSAGKNVIVAMAVVSVDTTLSTPDMGELGMVYSETCILTGIFGGLLFLILYRLTLKPLQVLNDDMDRALKGDLSQVTHEFKWEELNSLWDIINSAVQRIPRADAVAGGSGGGLGGSTIEVNPEEYTGPIKMLAALVTFGIVVFDSNQKIVFINSIFEEMSGIRFDGAMGREMSEVARDQAMGAFTSDILSRAPVGSEGVSEVFDFSGISYKMYVAAFGLQGTPARCFIMAAVRAES